jgi:hypothetical protein
MSVENKNPTYLIGRAEHFFKLAREASDQKLRAALEAAGREFLRMAASFDPRLASLPDKDCKPLSIAIKTEGDEGSS